MDNQNKTTKYILTAVAIAAIIAVATYLVKRSGSTEGVAEIPTTQKHVPIATTSADMIHVMEDGSETSLASSMFKDGTYTALGAYMSPAGQEHISVTVTLKNDVVTDTSAVVKATNQISVKMQSEFVAGYKTQVVGKKISDVKIDKVSGSSLTPKGFNDAISKIETQAKT